MCNNELLSIINKAVDEFHKVYLAKHPEDWDNCGFAFIQLYLGRKRKLKQQLIEDGVIRDEKADKDSYGSYYTVYTNIMEVNQLNHQSITYQEEHAKVVVNVLKSHYNLADDQVRIKSYLD